MRGGAPVARLDDLGAGEARVVQAFRHWCDGPQGLATFGPALKARFGPRRAAAALSGLDTCCRIVTGHARRPLARHSANCPCVGGDEAAFARLCASAAAGEREDAMLIACLLVRADMAGALAAAAEIAGLALAVCDTTPEEATSRPGPGAQPRGAAGARWH